MFGVVLLAVVSTNTKSSCTGNNVAEAVGDLGACTLSAQGCFASGGFNGTRYAGDQSCMSSNMYRMLFVFLCIYINF